MLVTRCSEQTRRKAVTQSLGDYSGPRSPCQPGRQRLENVRELLAFFFVGARTTAGRQDCCPLHEGATKANPVKTGDAKLRGYRTPCVPRRSSRRTSRRRGYACLRQQLGDGRRGARSARRVRTPTQSHSAVSA